MKRYAGLIIIVLSILLMTGVFRIILKPGRPAGSGVAVPAHGAGR